MKNLSINKQLLTLTAITLFSGMANADCPDDMPLNIMDDCIVTEGSGSSFPNATYSNLDEYNDWLDAREVEEKTPPSDN